MRSGAGPPGAADPVGDLLQDGAARAFGVVHPGEEVLRLRRAEEIQRGGGKLECLWHFFASLMRPASVT